MRKSQIPQNLSLVERLELLNNQLFDGDLDSFEPGDSGQEVGGRRFKVDDEGILLYGPPVAKEPGKYRMTINGDLIREKELKYENADLIVVSGKARYRVHKGILVSEEEMREYLASATAKEFSEKAEEIVSGIESRLNQKPEEEIETEIIAPVEMPKVEIAKPTEVVYHKPKRKKFEKRWNPILRERDPLKYKKSGPRQRLHYPGWNNKPIFEELDSNTHYLAENFKSVQEVINAIYGQPSGKYVVPVNGKARTFLVSSGFTYVYTGKGVAERLDRNYNAEKTIKEKRESNYNQKMRARNKK